jgi:predicted small lipoprotein YifL
MKKLTVTLSAILLCAALAACGTQRQAPAKQPRASDVVQAVAQTLTFKDQMMTLEDRVIPNIYNVDMDKLADKCCYVSSSGATAEEISVFRVKDAADLQMAKDAISERIEDQKIAFENYVPEEMVKIQNAVVLEKGDYILLVLADEVSGVKDAFYAQF